MNNDINNTLQALVPILQMNGETVKSIEAVQDWYTINGTEYMKEVAEITYTSGYRKYADIGCDANLTAVYDVMAVLQEIKPNSKCIGRIVRGVYEMPAVEPELKKLSEWRADFKGYINDLNIPKDDYDGIMEYIDEVPPAEQEAPDINVGNMDAISRQAAIDKFIDGLETIFSDIREREVDDSVCGLCEYDGAYIGQSGDWCNECPGFDRDDCFKLSDKIKKEWTDEIIKALPSAQPYTTTHDSIPAETGKNDGDRTSGDCISRQAAIDKITKRLFETAFNNVGIKQNIDETLVDVAENRLENWFNELPSIQPDIIHCKDCAYCDSDVVDVPYGMTKKVWWCDRLYAGANENLIVEPDDFCSWAERRE